MPSTAGQRGLKRNFGFLGVQGLGVADFGVADFLGRPWAFVGRIRVFLL